jgi:hypothetical protein
VQENDSVNIILLELLPEAVVVSTGTPFTIAIVVENVTELQNVEVEDVNNLMAASITLNFDATKLQYSSSSPGSFFSSAFIVPQILGSGWVTLQMLTLAEKPSGTGTILTVVFATIATGNTNITFGSTTLRDKDNITISHTKGSGCSVTIN